jgi:methenyltetrahydromethanopterin cyclohydrolase
MNLLNDRALQLTGGFLTEAEDMACEINKLPCGAILFDAGVIARGGFRIGIKMAEIGTAGLATINLVSTKLDENIWPSVEISTDFPLEACFLAQSANWLIEKEGFRAMGSGPACLLNPRLKIGQEFGYNEEAGNAVLVLEGRQLPNDAIASGLAAECNLKGRSLRMIIAPTSSMAGSVQIAARSIETALHKMHHLGLDITKVKYGIGSCPIAPPTGDDFTSLGRTNDAMMFGSRVWLTVEGVNNAELTEWAKKIPSSCSPGYGDPFLETLKKAGDFYKIDPGLFAPAEITLSSLSSGFIVQAGWQDIPRLKKAVFSEG